MKTNGKLGKNIITGSNEQDAETFRKIERFLQVLTNLRYEGKFCRGRNIAEANQALKFFTRDLNHSTAYQNRVVYPFLETHIPKLRTSFSILRSEQQELKRILNECADLLRRLTKKRSQLNQPELIEQFREKGIYFIYVLRNHIQTETESIYKLAERELNEEERIELTRLVKRFKSIRRVRKIVSH